MRILSIDLQPFHTVIYSTAGPGGQPMTTQLPFLMGTVDALPPGLQALICTSDLQGIVLPSTADASGRLLGEHVADELAILATLEMLPPATTTGVLLAGDLYASPDASKRGVEGDVRPVWYAFQRAFRWVVGVPGNHDRFTVHRDARPNLAPYPNMYYLDATHCMVDQLHIAGIGGIIGNPSKHLRRSEGDFIRTLRALMKQHPDIVVLHQSPGTAEPDYCGSEALWRVFEHSTIPLVVSGHTQWNAPIVTLQQGCQLLNTDSRVIILVEQA